MAGLFGLIGIGFITIYSAASQDVDLVIRQGIRIAIALLALVVLAGVDPKILIRWSMPAYLMNMILLCAVLFSGHTGNGAQRWLDLAGLRFQPSELIKITAPMMLSWYLSKQQLPPQGKQILLTLLLILTPTALIAAQPDLGTALVIGGSGAGALFIAGLSLRLISASIAVLAAMAPALWYLMHDYQRIRVISFLNPEADPLGAGYHTIQAKIAIGSGGGLGKGWLNGTQSQLEFVPETSTDFIFAVFAEEFGFAGCLGLLCLYLLIVGRCLVIAANARDTYAKLLATSLGLSFFMCAFINIAMTTGLLPVVGIPLPLVSYGGTSMVTLMGGFGMIMAIERRRRS